MAGKQKLYFGILDKKRVEILPGLEFLRRGYGFYLAGGTALALQIGHRTSLDFDFYCRREFDAGKVLESFRDGLGQVTLIQGLSSNTLIVRIRGIEISLFYYRYPLVKKAVRIEYIDLASKEDIAAMKLIAIIQRGKMRDFIDLYFLMKEFTLDEIFGWTKRKFSAFNPYLGLRALTFFKDAEDEIRGHRFRLMKKVDWPLVKQDILKRVSEYTRKGLVR
ncbi:MAG: nucleotidyl transferase AbiEii/AbiGii toxin family protein [Candidatus Omnitrophota bacterium]